MRLLFANFHRGWGGQSTTVMALALEMRRRGHDIVVAGVPGGELMVRSRASGLKTFPYLELARGFRPASLARDHVRMCRLLREFDPDGILSNGSQDTWACALARRRIRHRAFFVRWRHNTYAVAAHAVNRWLYRDLVDHVTVSSMTVAPLLTDNGLVSPGRITVFSPTRDLSVFLDAKPTAGLREMLGMAKSDPLAVSVGRLAPEKDHLTLVRAWKTVMESVPAAKLAIAGVGKMEQRVKDLVAQLDLANSVRVLGFRNDIPALYAEADVAALTPSGGESFGIALLEAYSAGLPCVATDVGGVREMVIDGETGFLLKPGDAGGIAEALVRILKDRELGERLGRTGRENVLARFTPEKLGEVAEELFGRLHQERQ